MIQPVDEFILAHQCAYVLSTQGQQEQEKVRKESFNGGDLLLITSLRLMIINIILQQMHQVALIHSGQLLKRNHVVIQVEKYCLDQDAHHDSEKLLDSTEKDPLGGTIDEMFDGRTNSCFKTT